ncbi:hypothetical protein [Streptomyces violaceus]|uniref:NfeD-like C-terminal domain-containing protein n=1 Tax=Streptomyces violaceus TaxID=1936 RepID=A0ABZ1NLH4_STRVL
MTGADWFSIGLCCGLVAAYITVRLGRRHRDRATRAKPQPAPVKTDQPQAAIIEIVERGRSTTDTPGGSVIIPNNVRINGQSLLVPRDYPVIVHEIKTDPDEILNVTLTLFARRITIAAEGDL